jgi:hypothetical protein
MFLVACTVISSMLCAPAKPMSAEAAAAMIP